MDRLFVPLNKHWYDMFKSGAKEWEVRGLCSRFNRQTVRVGRLVELRRGYMKEGALWGRIINEFITDNIYNIPIDIAVKTFPISSDSPLWEEILKYNLKYSEFIVFKIELI
jgi:hypothetical protein